MNGAYGRKLPYAFTKAYSERSETVRVMKIIAIFAILAALFGCGNNDPYNDPYILDGPGMEYVDSDYRTDYANCLPYDDVEGLPYMAIAYLGSGADGEANRDAYITKIFENLDDNKINQIKTYEYAGNDWFLVIPRYRSLVHLEKGDEDALLVAQSGEAFVVRCDQDIVVNIFEVTDIYFKLAVDENGKLKDADENVWDITNIDEVVK